MFGGIAISSCLCTGCLSVSSATSFEDFIASFFMRDYKSLSIYYCNVAQIYIRFETNI